MVKVVFVGDEPSKNNAHKDIAFVGAKCFKTLINWIQYLSPDYYLCINSNKSSDIEKIQVLSKNGFRLVALGEKASKRLGKLQHYKLPHPSGLNIKLNDKEYIRTELTECENFIWSIK